eukprot:COSAG03_NODE_311_length_9123_cov_2.643506_13_plen_73_part_00
MSARGSLSLCLSVWLSGCLALFLSPLVPLSVRARVRTYMYRCECLLFLHGVEQVISLQWLILHLASSLRRTR